MKYVVHQAYVDYGKPEIFKIPELKQYLLCRGISTRGKKSDLVARYYHYPCIGYGVVRSENALKQYLFRCRLNLYKIWMG